MTPTNQNDMSSLYSKSSNFHLREKEALKNACSKTGFVPTDVMGKSSWWGSAEIGASHYAGEYKGEKVVLKLQGVKPRTSEAEMIAKFKLVNESKLIRPPKLYAHLPWDEHEQYEGLILEWVGDEKAISKPASAKDIELFYSLYDDYRKNCLSKPWVQMPKDSLPHQLMQRFSLLIETRERLFPDHPLRLPGDNTLILEAVHSLCEGYEGVKATFQHGHFSRNDLYNVRGEVVLLSNLYWSWRVPFYDRIFAYHWFIYELSDLKDATIELVESQKELWLKGIDSNIFLPEDKRLITLAKFERAIAGLNLDALSLDPKKAISKYLVETTRREVNQLMEIVKREIN